MMAQPVFSKEIHAVSLGTMAAERLQAAVKWTVLSSYPTCFYCRDGAGHIVCIGKETIGNGPLNLLLPETSSCLFDQIDTRHSFTVIGDHLLFGNGQHRIILTNAVLWNCTLKGVDPTRETVMDDLHWLACQAETHAPAESLGSIIPVLLTGEPAVEKAGRGSALLHLLHNRVMKTAATLRRVMRFDEHPAMTDMLPHCRCLIGLGHGLTPSGDDFLAGMIMGLAKMGRSSTALSLAAMMLHEAAERTTQVSFSFYQAMAEGQICQSHKFFLDYLGNDLSRTGRHLLTDVTRYGATSGWDTIAGICFGISLEPIAAPASQHIPGAIVC